MTESAWAKTLASATEMETELREDGWEVITVRAGHVAPEPPAHGDTDRFGLVYLAQGEDAADFTNAVERAAFDGYEVFNRREGEDLFVLTRLTDVERELAVLLVGAVNLAHAADLATTARKHGVMYSHVQLLDGTHLSSFRHDDPSAFFPENV